MRFFNQSFFILFIMLLLSVVYYECANRVPISGGPADTIPPKLIHSNPKMEITNFNNQVFEFIFNERITLDQIKQELIITPRIDFEYEIKYGKKSFLLVFEENFQENTTYTFNFRESIQDVTEGNPTKDNRFTFSTGSQIDSLSIDGYTIDLLKNDTLKEVTVGLYRVDDTVTIFNGKPYYFAESSDSGYYQLNNIRDGKYLLYAFKDNNDNLELNSQSEPFAFTEDTIDLKQNIQGLNLFLLNSDMRDFERQTALPSGRNFDINFNKFIESYSVDAINFNKTVLTTKVKEGKSIRVFNTFQEVDSFKLKLNVVDTINQIIQDTVWVKFRPSKKTPDPFEFNVEPSANTGISESFEADIKFSKPVYRVNTDSVLFRYDTFPVATITKKEQILTNQHYDNLFIRFDLSKLLVDSLTQLSDSLKAEQAKKDTATTEADKKITKVSKKQAQEKLSQAKRKGLHFYLGNGAFISPEYDTTEARSFAYEFRKPEDYAIIRGNVNTDYKAYFIQLLTPDFNLVDEIYSQSNTFTFEYIEPGDYRIRVLIDENENKRWDLGNVKKLEMPEPVYFYQDPSTNTPKITLRANWELTDINLEF